MISNDTQTVDIKTRNIDKNEIERDSLHYNVDVRVYENTRTNFTMMRNSLNASTAVT